MKAACRIAGLGVALLLLSSCAHLAPLPHVRVAPPVVSNNVVILSATEMDLPDRLRAVWLDEQARWAKEVGATHIYVKSGHRIPRQQPEAVVDAVRLLLEKKKGGRSR